MKRVRAGSWLLSVSLSILAFSACKPASSGSARAPAPGASDKEEEPEDKTGGAAVPPATAPATTTASAPTTPAPAVTPTTITPGGGNGQPGDFIGNLISQFTGGGGLGGLTSSLGGLLNGGGFGGFDLGSLLNGLGGGLGGLTNNQNSGFGGGANTTTGAGATTPSANQIALVSNSGDLRVDCLNAINAYRASIGRAALTLKNDATTNSCVDKQAADDGAVGAAHRNFGKCGESAQDECPGWGGDTGTAQSGCLKMMWNEGPGGGHYENMANAAYRQVSCGYAQVGGKLWMIQNFYR